MGRKRTALQRFLRKVYQDVAEMRWRVLAIASTLHAFSSWLMLVLVEESTLTEFSTFFYFYMTTSTTVGYGDLSPQTEIGRWITILFIMVGGIALFTSVIAKSISSISTYWRRNMEGHGNYARIKGATVIIGHHPNRTRRMIDEVHGGGDEADKLILMTRKTVHSPDIRVHYVLADSLASEDDLRRAAVADAEKVIVYADNDEQTLSAALAVAALNPDAHLVAFFIGAQSALSSTTENATVYSLKIPDGLELTYQKADRYLKNEKRSNLIAAKTPTDSQPTFNPVNSFILTGGSLLYFIRDERLNPSDIDWEAMTSAA